MCVDKTSCGMTACAWRQVAHGMTACACPDKLPHACHHAQLAIKSAAVAVTLSLLLSSLDTASPQPEIVRYADYSMYSTFLTALPGSVLFSRSTLLKRKDLHFSCLRLGRIRHRGSLRSSHLFSSACHDFIVSHTRELIF
jgi:hypothetical protein